MTRDPHLREVIARAQFDFHSRARTTWDDLIPSLRAGWLELAEHTARAVERAGYTRGDRDGTDQG